MRCFEAERNPLNLTPVSTGVGKPQVPAPYCFIVGDKHERCH